MLLLLCSWGRTVSMNQALCQKIGGGAFPSAAEVSATDLKKLQDEAGLGYRAKNILALAQKVIPFLRLPELTRNGIKSKSIPCSNTYSWKTTDIFSPGCTSLFTHDLSIKLEVHCIHICFMMSWPFIHEVH